MKLTCRRCKGYKKIDMLNTTEDGENYEEVTCPACRGAGSFDIREGMKVNVVKHQHLGDEHLVMTVRDISVRHVISVGTDGGWLVKFDKYGKSKILPKSGQKDDWEIVSVVERDPDAPLNALDFTFHTAGWSNWNGYGIRATYIPTGISRSIHGVRGLNEAAGAAYSCSFIKVNEYLQTDKGRQHVFDHMVQWVEGLNCIEEGTDLLTALKFTPDEEGL